MIASLITLVVYLIVVGLIMWLLHHLIEVLPLPEPFKTVARIALLVLGVLIIILLLLQFTGMDLGAPRLRG